MEQINRIELAGFIGNISVKSIEGTKMARFAVATNYAYKSKDGCAVIDTTWHSCVAWEGPDIADLENIKKGDQVHLFGRIRQQGYVDSSGYDRTISEVVVSELKLVED